MATDPQYLPELVRSLDGSIQRMLQVCCDHLGAYVAAITDASGTVLAEPIWSSAATDQDIRSGMMEGMRSAAQKANATRSSIREECRPHGITSLARPIVLDEESLGAVVVAARTGDQADGTNPAWDSQSLPQAELFLQSVTATVTRLCYQERELRNRVEELSTVYSVAGMLAGRRDLQEILDLTSRQVVEVMGVKACSIRLLDEATGLLTIKAVCNLSQAYLDKGPVRVEGNPIDSEALAGKAVYVEDAPTDPRTRYPEQAAAEGLASSLVVGMVFRGKPVGVIRVYTGTRHRFTPFEALLLRSIAFQTAAAIVNARLLEEAMEADRYARQLKYAGDVQRRMIPRNPPVNSNVQFGCVYKPTLEVGGDFYDFIELPKGHIGIAIADVVGKGVPGSVMMASVRSALRAYAHNVYDLDEIISHVNRHFCRDTLSSEFATLFYGVLTPDGRKLTYSNAGHDPPLLLRGDQIRKLEAGGLVIGVSNGEAYGKEVVSLKPGDVLLFYTDGVVEALNFEGESFGRERLNASLIRHRNLDGSQIAQNVLWDVRRFVGLADQSDDITLVSMKVR